VFLTDKKFGLVLGGGGSRALAHFGVLRALEERGIKPSIVAGASAGAIVGALYCAGMTSAQMCDQKRLNSWFKIATPAFALTGFARLTKLGEIIEKNTGVERIEDLEIPFRIVTTNLVTAEPVVHKSGRLGQIVSASCSIPGLFSPVLLDGEPHVDGSMSGNLPLFAFDNEEVETIIVVDPLKHCRLKRNPVTFYRIVVQAFVISLKNTSPVNKTSEESIIRIEPKVSLVDPFRFKYLDYLEKAGYEAACGVLDSVQ
jgi:NTE family protein